MSIIGFLVLGLVASAITKALWSGDEPGGFLGTLLVGVVGALLGGLIASTAGLGGLGGFFDLQTWLIALGGAFLFLFLFNLVASRGAGKRPATREG